MDINIMEIIAKTFAVDVCTLSTETRFNEDLDAESLQKFMIVADIEEITGKKITYQKFNKNCKTIGETIAFVKSLTE